MSGPHGETSAGGLRLYDTMARQAVPIRPAGRALTVYSCGPTVYRTAHIGNLRTFATADLIRRAVEYRGVEVRQVMNITDVGHMTDEMFDQGEDRMLVAAGLENRSPQEVAAHYTDLFLADVAAFNIRPASAYPRASEYIGEMISLIRRLLERGHAYEYEGTVYFDVRSFPAYGRLSGNTLEELQAGHRKHIHDPGKRFHADFVLWMAAGPRRVLRFPSPWGEGYPGWHIECSAMSTALLGEDFDLHTGGVDNIFPHHEDEIAQSEGALGHPVVRHWVHGEHLLTEGRKMAKSTGNVYDLETLASRGHPDPLAARLLFLQAHWRAQMNFTLDALGAAERTLARWRHHMADWWEGERQGGPRVEEAERRFVAALEDNLDTPSAVALVAEVTHDPGLAPGDKASLLARWDQILGLDLAREATRPAPLPEGAGDLIEQRERARAARDYPTADRLRDELRALGVEIEDTPAGPKPRVTSPRAPRPAR